MISILFVCPAIAHSNTTLAKAAKQALKLINIDNDLSRNELLNVYPEYWSALIDLNNGNDQSTNVFLSDPTRNNSYLGETLRNQWLKFLAKNNNWQTFSVELNKLPTKNRDEETTCYAELIGMQQGQQISVKQNWLRPSKLPDGCNQLIIAAANHNWLNKEFIRQRIRYLLAGNYLDEASALAFGVGIELNLNNESNSESALYKALRNARKDPYSAANLLSQIQNQLTPEQNSFAFAWLALQAAKKLDARQALVWYTKTNPNSLNDEQWEWWARSALRVEDWAELDSIISKMPQNLSESRSWMYWKARCLAKQNRQQEANNLYQQVSATGRNFYALLSKEELGSSVYASKNTRYRPSQSDIQKIANEPAIQRALALFDISQQRQQPELRKYANQEWRWAMRNRSDKEFLTAATLANQKQFIEMSIYSADQTKQQHNFSLRYPTPYRNLMNKYSTAVGLDEAWAYGLIRQESRFVLTARSGVGASGMMQIMPATARLIARKLGEKPAKFQELETNIRYGTWYLQNINGNLGDEVLATAGYNAGPNRARAWRANNNLEGAIYAETIPFNETRAYVKRVMTNATYYAFNFGQRNVSLKRRLGSVPAKY